MKITHGPIKSWHVSCNLFFIFILNKNLKNIYFFKKKKKKTKQRKQRKKERKKKKKMGVAETTPNLVWTEEIKKRIDTHDNDGKGNWRIPIREEKGGSRVMREGCVGWQTKPESLAATIMHREQRALKD